MFQKLARACLYAAPFALAVVLPSTYFPFIGAKYYLFRVFVTLAASFTLIGWAFEDEPRSLKERFWPVLRSPAAIGFMFLTGAVLLASAFAYDASAAFWSNYERGEGSFQFIHYLLFFVLMGGLLTERKHWKTLMKTSIAAALLVVLYGTLAALSPGAFLGPYGGIDGGFLARITATRFQGSLGNAAYVTPYLIFIAAYVVWLWNSAKTRIKASVLAGIGLLVAAAYFLLSGTRGAFMGLLAGLFVAAVWYAWRVPRARRWVIGAMALGVLAVAGLFGLRNTALVAQLPGARLLQIDFSQATAQTRFWTWEAALKGFRERPVLGYGPENFPVVFDKHFDPRHFEPGKASETWFDRAHNVVLDYLATTGAVGLLAWLAFIVLIFVQLLRAARARNLSPLEEALLIGLPVAYVVQSLLLFDVLPIFMNLGIVAAIAVAASFWKPRGDHTVIPASHDRDH